MDSTPPKRTKKDAGISSRKERQENQEESKAFFENLKSSRSGQKAFNKDDLNNFHKPIEYAQDVPIPYPNTNEDTLRMYIKDRFYRRPPRDGIIPADKHMIVTEYSLDHWLAQTFKINIDQVPTVRPQHIPKAVYEQLKKYVKHGQYFDQDKNKNAKRRNTKKVQDEDQTPAPKNTQMGNQNNPMLVQTLKQEQQITKPQKYHYIIYPRTMNMVPYVDILEQQMTQEKPEKNKDIMDSFDDQVKMQRDAEEANNQQTNPEESPLSKHESPNRSKSKSKGEGRKRARSRNNLTTKNQPNNGFQTTGGSQSKIQKLPNFQKYQRPSRSIRNRVSSGTINFLNPQEIEKAATGYEKYLQQMKSLSQTLSGQQNINSSQQQIKDEKPPSQEQYNTLNNKSSNKINEESKKEYSSVPANRSAQTALLKNRRHHLRGSVHQMTSTLSSMIINPVQKTMPSISSPYTNMQNNILMTDNCATASSGCINMSTPATAASPRDQYFLSPRVSGQLQIRSALMSKLHQHLDKAKTITQKSKLRQFQDRMNEDHEHERSEKLGSIVRRNLGMNSSTNLDKHLSSPYLNNDTNQAMPHIKEIHSGTTLINEQGHLTSSATNIILNRGKYSNINCRVNRLDTTTSSENVLVDDQKSLQTCTSASQSQRNSKQQVIATVIKHLEDEIEESKTSPRDLISLNMIEITMDFNELQKRYNDMNDPNFWLQKAIQKQKNQSLVAIEGAIDYYKQGLRITPQSEKLLYNIGCSYEKIGKFENAIRWFKHVLEVNPKNPDAHYGLALATFKMRKYHESLQSIERCIEFYNQSSLFPYDYVIYFRAMCFKKVGDQTQCQRDYQSLREKFQKNMNHDMVKYVFGILLLPLQEDRKLMNNFVENFNELMIFFSQRGRGKADLKQMLSQFCFTKKLQPPWKFDFAKYKNYIYYYLQKRSFFKRLGRLSDFSKEIEHALIHRYEKHDMVLLPSEDHVGVVLFGTLFAIAHSGISVMKPRILFKCVEGSIIGHPDLDNGASSHSETWLTAYETTEIIFFKKEHFQRLWDSQRMHTNKQIIMCSLHKNLFFHFLSQQLKHFLVFEKLIEIHYQPGEIIVLQAKRSYMNERYSQYYENRFTKIRQEIENKKSLHEANTGKKHSEIGSLMEVMRENNQLRKMTQALGQGLSNQIMEIRMAQAAKQGNSLLDVNSDEEEEEDDNGERRPEISFDHALKDAAIVPQAQCPEEDQDDPDQPYCKGVYIVISGSIDVIYKDEKCFTLNNGDSFGESLIIKQPSYEYFGDMIAGPHGAKCYLFLYDVLRTVPFQTINDMVELAGFQRRKEGLMHVLSQKYDLDIGELSKY